MRRIAGLAALALCTGVAPPVWAQSGDSNLPQAVSLDTDLTIGAVEVGCTGIGQTKHDPRWAAYPVRIEFANAQSLYLSDATIDLANASGAPLASISCEGPWILLKLPAGRYTVHARLNGSTAKPRSASFSPPAKGQMRLVLQFPDAVDQ